MVKAPDGDFDAIAQLSKTLNNAETLNITIKFLSRHPQGKQAFIFPGYIVVIDQ